MFGSISRSDPMTAVQIMKMIYHRGHRGTQREIIEENECGCAVMLPVPPFAGWSFNLTIFRIFNSRRLCDDVAEFAKVSFLTARVLLQ